jgi:hypothetical protein
VLQDQPDDAPGAPQIEYVYMRASDSPTDRLLDVNGVMQTSIAAMQNWMKAKTGGSQFKLDTVNGTPDIVFYQSPHTQQYFIDAGGPVDFYGNHPYIRNVIETELQIAGFSAVNKLYVVWYDGKSDRTCADGAWPMALNGNVAVLYLQGVVNGISCAGVPFAATPDAAAAWYWEPIAAHESDHLLGLVPSCAPNMIANGHVANNNDLMCGGPACQWALGNLSIDAGHTDYFGAGIAGCWDLSNSAFMDPLPANPQLPPGWNVVTTAATLQARSAMRSMPLTPLLPEIMYPPGHHQ